MLPTCWSSCPAVDALICVLCCLLRRRRTGRRGMAFQIGNAALHPIGLRRAFQEVIEVLLQTDRVVLLVRTAAQTVRLSVIDEQICFLPQAAQRQQYSMP